jgi:hypothetical protein
MNVAVISFGIFVITTVRNSYLTVVVTPILYFLCVLYEVMFMIYNVILCCGIFETRDMF